MNQLKFILDNSLLLVLGTVTALLWANLGPESYAHVAHGPLHFVVNDILMCIFFGMAAKEIWEALLPGGALSSPKKAATPLLATMGGVLGPVAIYLTGVLIFNQLELTRGWAVPTATDIAFSYLVARFVFGAKHPAIPFLLLLAIADDAIGLIILGIFYAQGEMQLVTFALCVSGALLFNIFVLRRWLRPRTFWAYLVIAGPLSWYGFYKGGIHPALAFVALIPTFPHASHDVGLFAEQELSDEARPHDALNEFQRFFRYPTEVILLLFGLVNAGVAFTSFGFASVLVGVALLVGKPVGISLFTFVAVKILRLDLPSGMNMKDVVVLGITAGIGFTVALFVCGVAFPPGDDLDAAKIGALSSFFASVFAYVFSKILGVKRVHAATAAAVPVTSAAETSAAE